MSKSSLILLAPLLAGLCACGTSGETQVSGQPRTVLVAPVTPPDGSGGVASGIVRAEGAGVVAAEIGGRVTALLADVGDHVVQGQVLARLDPSAARLRVNQAAAEARQAAAAADLRARHAARTAQLHAENAATEADLESARSEAAAATAARDAAGAALALARRDAAQSVLRAPVSGVIAERPARLGAVLAPGEAAFAIEGAGARRIDAVLPDDLARQLGTGARLAFRYPGGTGEARLAGVSARAAGGGSGRQVVLDVTSGAPAPGVAVELALQGDAGPGQGMRVPLAAIRQQRGGNPSVLVVAADKRLRAVPVRLAAITGASAVVAGKLAPGDLVVAAGGEFLEPGLTVRPHRTQR